MNDATCTAQDGSHAGCDPLEETQQNPELPRLLAIRAARGLAHLTLDSASTTEADSARGAAKAALLFTAVIVTVALLVTVHLVGQSHGIS
jgi:hypothetical protein